MPSRRLRRVCLLLALASGGCGLVYQVTWMRALRLVFGASTAASAATLAIFMGGLGFGAWALGGRADRAANPLRLYGILEILVAVGAALSPALIAGIRHLYILAGGTPALGDAGGSLLRLGLSALLLTWPAVAMGGTLPALARVVETAESSGRRHLGALYGANTLGAFAGTLVANFAALEYLGSNNTIFSAAALNLLVGAVALVLSRDVVEAEAKPAPSDPPKQGTKATRRDTVKHRVSPRRERNLPTAAHLPMWLALVAATVVGAAFFAAEIVWYRMLSPLLGGSVYTFGLVLAVALLGIGAGAILYSVLAPRRQHAVIALAVTCALEASLIAFPYALGDRIAVLAIAVRPTLTPGLLTLIPGWLLITTLVVLPAALVSGYQFPLLVNALGSGSAPIGAAVGRVYAMNTLGAIAGSLAGGLWLLPLLSSPGLWRLVVYILAALSCLLITHAWRSGSQRRACVATALTALLAGALCAAPGPSAFWRHSPIGAGRLPLASFDSSSIRRVVHQRRTAVVWEAEGRESSVALQRSNGYALLINGKSDGSAFDDASTQIMLGLIPAILHPEPRRALVIGLGTGQTAGWLAQVESIERVDVIELEPAVVQAAAAFNSVNHAALRNPKVHVLFGDARELLLTRKETYDVIVSEPSNPFRAGIASLFTRELYQAVAQRLNRGGLFAQWVQAYEMSTPAVYSIYATLASVWPTIDTWEPGIEQDLVLVAQADDQPTQDVARTQWRVDREPYRSALAMTWGVNGIEGLYSAFVAGRQLIESVTEKASEERINTDDRTILEFECARSVGRKGLFEVESLRSLAQRQDSHRPALVNGSIDWPKVDEMLALRAIAGTQSGLFYSAEDPATRQRIVARQMFAVGKLEDARREWGKQSAAPTTLADRRMLATILADAGDEGAPAYIDAVEPWQPAAAAALRGVWHARRGDPRQAAEHTEAAFLRYRQDPWSSRELLTRALDTARQLAHTSPALAKALFEGLREPFAARALDHRRLLTRTRMAARPDAQLDCVAAFSDLEPHPPWERTSLEDRYQCYRRMAHPLAMQARRDLDHFVSHAVSTPPTEARAEGRR